jgi:hypothetical protein
MQIGNTAVWGCGTEPLFSKAKRQLTKSRVIGEDTVDTVNRAPGDRRDYLDDSVCRVMGLRSITAADMASPAGFC